MFVSILLLAKFPELGITTPKYFPKLLELVRNFDYILFYSLPIGFYKVKIKSIWVKALCTPTLIYYFVYFNLLYKSKLNFNVSY